MPKALGAAPRSKLAYLRQRRSSGKGFCAAVVVVVVGGGGGGVGGGVVVLRTPGESVEWFSVQAADLNCAGSTLKATSFCGNIIRVMPT